MTLLVLLACAPEPTAVPIAGPPAWVDSRSAESGQPIVLHAPPGSAVTAGEGLLATPGEPGTWTLDGKDGSYVVEVTPPGGEAARIFVDVGVTGPTGGPMADLLEPPPPPPARWPYALAAVLAVVAAGVAVAAWRRRRRAEPPPPPPERAEVVARRAWAAIRAREDLAAEAAAGQLAGVYRVYLEAQGGFPATQRTTREILDNLAGSHTAAQLGAAKRLLGAMDLVRFADREARLGIFEELDRDFDALVPGRAP